MKHTLQELYQWQALPLSIKIRMTQQRIRDWVNEYGEDGVYVSFSGGKDSTVLLDIVRNRLGYKNIPAVFVDVPTQYPELRDFVKTFDNVEIIKTKKNFMEVCEKYGFPFVSKETALYVYQMQRPQTELNANTRRLRLEGIKADGTKVTVGQIPKKWRFLIDAPFRVSSQCCITMKEEPLRRYSRESKRNPITAQMASESRVRARKWLQNGCNMYDLKDPISNPMNFWLENDVLQYIAENNLPICSVYGNVVEDSGDQLSFVETEKKYKTTGCQRTGCMLCGFGCHLEKSPNRFEQLKETHPGMYNLLDVVKNNGVTFREAIEWINEHGNLNIKL